jgi:hypothetical protein
MHQRNVLTRPSTRQRGGRRAGGSRDGCSGTVGTNAVMLFGWAAANDDIDDRPDRSVIHQIYVTCSLLPDSGFFGG